MNTTIPELSDEQIDSMRFAIMSDVDKSARAKTRRYRRAAGGLAVAAAFVTVVGSTAVNLPYVGFSNGSSDSVEVSRSDSGSASSPDLFSAGGGESADRAGGDSAGKTATDREIVTTGAVSMRVARPVDAASKISSFVSAAGGRVDSRQETAAKGDDGGSVHLVVRIPQTKVDGAIDEFRSFGTVEQVNISDYDATTQGKDLDARIQALRISVGRLEGLMKNANTTSELLRAESALTERQAELDSLVSQRKGLSEQVALSSLEIDLAAKPMANSVSPSGFWGGVVTGWNGLVATIDGAVHGLGVILPWGIVLGVLSGIAWLVSRRRSSRVA